MSVTVELNLSDAIAAKARAKGLLDPQTLTRLIERELAKESESGNFFQMARELHSHPGEPMALNEIQEIVDEVRSERAARETGC
jgi:hypothetical protein